MKHLLVVLLIALPTPAAAQMVFRPRPPLDSAQVELRDALLVFRDTMHLVHGATARLRRDFKDATPASLLSRATDMRAGCAAAARNAPGARSAVAAGPAATAAAQRERTALLEQLDRMAPALAECERHWDGWVRAADAEAVRGYGNERAAQLQPVIRRYERALERYFRSVGIRVRPIGA